MRNALAAAAVLVASGALLAGCSGPDVPSPPVAAPSFGLELVRDGFAQPVFLGHAGDGSGRVFVVEQRGVVQELRVSGTVPFLDLSDRVLAGGERGLLGIAFHPRFAETGRLFVHYTDEGGDTQLSEFRRGGDGRMDAASERKLLHVEDPYPNHNGGMVAFGPDGFLYLALGDGGSAGDPQDRAQDLDTLMGKLLRIDVDRSEGGRPYAIPDDNPYADRGRGAEVWAYGLRNPWRFSFDRGAPDGSGKGDLWIGDVGQNRYEEIDHQPASSRGGENYGWSRYEGRHVHIADRDAPDAVDPVAEYDHDGGHCAVTGGYVYRGDAVPGLRGAYVFGDYCSGVVWTLRLDGDGGPAMHQVLDTDLRISSFGEDEDGELYVVDHGGGVHRVVPRAA